MKLSLTYSATARRVVTQFRPIFLPLTTPRLTKYRRCPELSPTSAAASESEISSSWFNGLLAPYKQGANPLYGHSNHQSIRTAHSRGETRNSLNLAAREKPITAVRFSIVAAGLSIPGGSWRLGLRDRQSRNYGATCRWDQVREGIRFGIGLMALGLGSSLSVIYGRDYWRTIGRADILDWCGETRNRHASGGRARPITTAGGDGFNECQVDRRDFDKRKVYPLLSIGIVTTRRAEIGAPPWPFCNLDYSRRTGVALPWRE